MKDIVKFLFFIVMSGLFRLNDVHAYCVNVERIRLNSDVQLTKKEKDKVLKPFLSRCLRVEDLNRIAKDITNQYIKEGYLTAKVTIPEQRLENATLILDVEHGKISKISYEDTDAKSIQDNFSRSIGKAVNIRDIEQVVEDLNQLRSNNISVALRPGEEVGETYLVVQNKKEKNLFVNIGLDNSGGDEGKKLMGSSSLTLENLLHLNDSLYLVERHNMKSFEKNLLRNYSFVWTGMLGSYKYMVNYDYGYHKDRLDQAGQSLIYSGKHRRGGIDITKNFIRSKYKNFDVNLGYRKSYYLEKIDDHALKYQSYKLSIAELGFSLTNKFPSSSHKFSCSLQQGLPHDYTKLDYISALQPESVFTKFICNSNLTYRLHSFSDFSNLYFVNGVKLQHSNAYLYSSEKFDISASDAVRGASSANMKGDRGFSIHNDIIYDSNLFSAFQKVIGRVQFFAGVDYGGYKNNDNNSAQKTIVSSASVGLRIVGGSLSGNLSLSRLLSNSAGLKPKNPPILSFSIALEV